jgi:PKD repeat protein
VSPRLKVVSRFKASRLWCLVILCCFGWFSPALSQNKVNITSVTPSRIHLCAEAGWLEIDVRNITTSTLTSLSSKLTLPTGMKYIKSSLSGTGVTESNISDLQKPIFDLPDLKLATSVKFKVQVEATCPMINFLDNGGLAIAKVVVVYPGGKVSQNTSPFNIVQPSVKITSVTNQFATVDLGSVVSRIITITNGGKGKVNQIQFQQINESGMKITGYSGGNTSTSGDTIWSSFDKSHISQVGNKDSFLDQNETLLIYDTILISSCTKLKSYYSLKWGCDGSTCATDFSSATVTISTRTPVLSFTPKSSTTVCFANSNKHLQELTISNSGNDTARNVLVDIFQGINSGYYQYELSRIDETDISIKIGSGSFKNIRAKSKTSTNSGGGRSCLGGGAIGAVLLEIPDMAPGTVVLLKWYSISCCTDACNLNFYAHRWKYKAKYDNQCGTTISKIEAFGSYGYVQSFLMTQYTPSDVINNQTIEFNFKISSASLLTPASTAQMIMHFKLPSGVKHSKSVSDFRIENDNNQSWQPNSVYQKNDTVFAVFIGAPKIALARSELKIKVTGDCSSNSINADRAYGLDIWYNPSPSCKDACNYQLYCFTSTIRVHCDKACSTGFSFSDFEAKRTTYGSPDNNNDGEPDSTGSIDLSKIKLERVMFGDTLTTTFRGKINPIGSTRTFRYLKASSTIDFGYYMKAADVRLKIYRAGSLLYSCNGISSSFTTSGYKRTFTFDVGVSALISARCPLYSGFLFGIKDSVELEVKYVYDINPGGVIREVNLTNDMYLSTVANPSGSQRYQCDTFGGKFVMIGYYYANYGRNTFTTNSCNQFEVTQGYYLSVGSCCANYAGNNIFPYEYRNWSQMDGASIILPKGFEVVDARFYQYRTTGTGKRAWQYTDSLKPTYYSGDTAFYETKSLHTPSGGKLIPSDDGFFGYFYYKLQSNCEAKQGTSPIHYQFMMAQQNYLGSEIDTISTVPSNADAVLYEKPDISLIAEQDNIKAKSDTAVWNVRLGNGSYISKAEYVWISYRQNGNTRITQIRNRVTGKIILATNDIFQLGNLSASETVNLEVSAVFDNCNKDSFELLAGFNCEGYPDSLAQYPCAPLDLWLSYTPVNTRLSATLNDSLIVVDLCQEVPYEVSLTNEGEARVFNVFLDLYLREGMILGDTAWAFEPGTNDSFAVTGASLLGDNIFRYDISKFSSNLTNSGLPGFSSGSSNNFKFKFFLETNCDFVSSSYFLLKPGGSLKCGLPVISSYGIGKPINIKNVDKPYFSSFTMDMNPLDVCNYDGKMRFKFINLGPDTTGVKDKIQLLLPKGIYVDTTYLKSLYRGPTGSPVISNKGLYKAEWSIPDSTIPGDSSFFEINTYVIPSELSCGYTQIIGQAIVKQPALCVKDSSICNIDVATSSALILDSIQKSDYQINFITGVSVPAGSKESATLSYSVTNRGSIKTFGTLLRVKYVDDVNGNLRYDSGEQIVYADTILRQLARDSSVSLTSTVLLSPAQTCRLILLIDSTNCVCDISAIRVPAIQIDNAGRDTLACSNTDIIIGTPSTSGSTYSWTPSLGIVLKDSSLANFNYVNLTPDIRIYRRILATNKGSCTTYDTVVVRLYPAMQLSIPDEYNLCRSDSVIIGNIVKGGNGFKSYQWSPTIGISKPNNLKVWAKPTKSTQYKIEITDGAGCILRDSTQVTVVDRPRADFSVKDTCAQELFTFSDATRLGGTGIDSVYWDFGLLGNSTAKNPSIFIDSAQVLFVKYYIQDSLGCEHDTVKPVTSFPLPVPLFSVSDDCQYDTVFSSNQSTIEYGTFTSKWLVDGSTKNTSNLLHTFNNAGIYPVELVELSNRNCSASFFDTLEIHAKPELRIESKDVCKGDSTYLSFTNTNGNDSITSLVWNTDEGQILNDPNPSLMYSDTGSHFVNLLAETQFGCRDTATHTHGVNSIPKADFVALDVCIGDTTFISSQSSIEMGNISSYLYDLGSGLFNGSIRLDYNYPSSGMFPIKHIVISDAGCVDTISKTTQVHYKEKPNLTVTGNCQDEPIDLSFNPANIDSINLIRWTVNSIDTFGGQNLVYPFTTAGTNNIGLFVETKWGCKSDTIYKVIIDPKPTASFNALLPCEDDKVEFTNTSTTKIGSLTQYDWDLGDGTTSNAVDVNHTYGSLGSYSVVLHVENSFGCKDTAISSTDIENIVVPDFDFVPACVFDSASFTHTTTGLTLPANYGFILGDGNEVWNTRSFKHAYSTDGSYSVRLTISTSSQCYYDTIKQIDIYPLPIPGFDIDPPITDILNSDVQVIDQSSGAQDYLYWLSDGNSYSSPEFKHHFNDSGSYIIRQILTTDKGCVDSFERFMTIGYLVNILIPNAFSPNADDLNETFGPGGIGLINYDLTIYNRWGEKIYETNSGIPWDGKDGLLGVYYYALKMTDYKGKFHYAYGEVLLNK